MQQTSLLTIKDSYISGLNISIKGGNHEDSLNIIKSSGNINSITIKDSFKDDLISFLDNDDDSRPMITHTNDKNMKVFLQVRNTYKYSDKLVEKRTRIKNLQADLKAAEEKAVRENKAVLTKADYSVVFKG